jgi:subtilisin family serine protease
MEAQQTMTSATRSKRLPRLSLLALLATAGVLVAACAPEPAPPPDGTATSSTSTTTTTTNATPPTSVCSTLGAAEPEPAPSPAAPVAYVATVEKPDGTLSAETFVAESPHDKAAALDAIEATTGDVVAVEPDQPVQTLVIDDPQYAGAPGQWWIDRVGFEAAWGPALAQGAGVRVAIVDTGVQADHPDLGRAETGGNVVAGSDQLDASVVGDERTDTGSHGTHVAGIAGALDNTIGGIGGAPRITIVPVRVLNGDGGAMSAVIAGVLWAADPAGGDADVINLSLGSTGCSEGLYAALEYAVSQGVTVTIAAGNCGCTTQRLYPAAFSPLLDGVIAVAATTSTDTRASFSNIGDYVTIAAPGSAILSTIPANGYGTKNGTSMAAPVVAATAALVKAKCPAYTPAQIQQRLVATSEDLGAPGWDTSFGAGLVRADRAVAAAC